MSHCEACGVIGAAEYVRVELVNGGLCLCRLCLDEFNGKNPRVKELEVENAALQKRAGDQHAANMTIYAICACAYQDICAALGWGYDPTTNAAGDLPRALAALLARDGGATADSAKLNPGGQFA